MPRQALASRLGADDCVLDPYAEFAYDVDARLVAEDHASGEGERVVPHHVWVLVDLEAYAVAEAVDEVLAVARLLDDLPRGDVDGFAGCAGFYCVEGGLVRL